MRVGGISGAAAGKDAERLVFELDTYFHQGAVAISIDPEWPADLLGQLIGEDRIQNGKQRFWSRGRQIGLRLDVDAETQLLASDADDALIVVFFLISLQKLDDRCDVARYG
ncbi:hypothetical protein D3C87_1259170 [compost metagenome]